VNVDLFLLALVAVFAILGAFSGAARQLARLIAAIGAAIAARFGAPYLAPYAAKQLQSSPTVGLVLSSLLLFFVGFLVIRQVAQGVLLRILAGKDAKERGLDRALGFVLGGARVGAIAWFVLCALAFLEDNVSIAGQRLQVAPKGSALFQLARNHNLFAMTQVPGLSDLVEVAKVASDPQRAEALKKSPAFAALQKNPRFKEALASDAVRRALETGDHRALMTDTDVLKLLADPQARRSLEEALEAAER
jgi:membrane protein required for colicin V production